MRRERNIIFAATAGVLGLLIVIFAWSTLSQLSNGYEVTDGKVFYRTFNNVNWQVDRKEVVGADPNSITTLENSGGQYASDDTRVFFQETGISNADASSFRVLERRRKFSRDANHAYWKSIRLSDDPNNFEVLSRGYSKDTQHVYFTSQIVEDADPDTFIVTGTTTSHAKDKNYQHDMGRIKN